MKLSKSQAHYIKAVYELSSGDTGVRVVDVAEKLFLSKASVSLAMTKLARQGFVRKDSERHIYLTDEGEREAVRMLDKFEVIHKFLTGILGVNKEVAERDAYAIEHVISVDTLCALCRFTDRGSATCKCSLHCPVSSEEDSNNI